MEAILFDVGGVLVSHRGFLERALALFRGVDPARFWAVFNEAALPACRGEESLTACGARLSRHFGVPVPDDQVQALLLDDFRTQIALDTEVLELARTLMRAHKVGIVSNTIRAHSAILRDLGVYEGFEPVVLSHEVGRTKDDPRIFTYALQRLGTLPEHTVFIDDVERFAQTAGAVGLRPIVFQHAAQLKQALRDCGCELA